MAIHVQPDGRIDRGAKIGHRLADAEQLGWIEPIEDRPEDLVGERVDLFEQLLAGLRHSYHDNPTIAGHSVPLDETALHDSVDEARDVRIRYVQDVGQPAHRHVTMALDGVHDVDLGHADALVQESLARGALELGHRRPEIGDDGSRQVRRRGHDVFSSCHMNNIADTDHPVNLNGPCCTQESPCVSR